MTLYWLEGAWAIDTHEMNHTHRITFDLIDGKPDCGSIKMEKIDE